MWRYKTLVPLQQVHYKHTAILMVILNAIKKNQAEDGGYCRISGENFFAAK